MTFVMKKIVVTLAIVTFFALGLSATFIMIFASFGIGTEILFDYHVSRFDLVTNNSEFIGTVSLKNQILEDDIVSIQGNDESVFIISAIGEDEYKCTGSCYCNDEEFHEDTLRRNLSPTTLKRGLSYVFAAATTIVATKTASTLFSEICAREFSAVCEMGKIEGRVNDCVRNYVWEDDEEFHLEEEREREMNGQHLEKKVFSCVGFCVPKNLVKSRAVIREAQENHKCVTYATKGEIIVEKPLDQETWWNVKKNWNPNRQAKFRFRRDVLNSFCWLNSKYAYQYKNPNTGWRQNVEIRLCSAISKYGEFKDLKNIHCHVKGPDVEDPFEEFEILAV